MSDTKISWADKTWNMMGGCEPCSAGCANCAAARCASGRSLKNHPLYKGLTKNGKWTGEVRLCTDIGRDDILEQPLHWRAGRKIFPAFMSDLFRAPFDFIAEVFGIMGQCPQHEFLVLTKQIEDAHRWFRWLDQDEDRISSFYWQSAINGFLPNVHFGTSISTPDDLKNVKYLLQIPAAKRFISFEPLLEDINAVELFVDDKGNTIIDYIIIGAESKGAWPGRECQVEWIRSLVRQADAAGVGVHIKQMHLWRCKNCGNLFEKQQIEGWGCECGAEDDEIKRVLVKNIKQFPADLQRRDI